MEINVENQGKLWYNELSKNVETLGVKNKMLGKNKAQFNAFDNIIFDKLIPKNHLLVEIDEVVDFSFVYEQLKR